MPDAVIVDAVRTPIGRAGKGSLRAMRADALAAVPIRALVERNPSVDFAQTADVIMGAAYGTGEQGANIGRTASLLAGLDHHVPACTVNRFCASSLMAIRMAAQAIRAGEGEQYVAAGVEAVSRGVVAPLAPEELNPRLDGSEGSLCDVYIPMGMTAENVADRCGVSRQTQDEWAVISQTRAVAARDGGHFDAEIVPVTVPAHRARSEDSDDVVEVAETVVSRDDGPRPG
ncbi:MAG: beta-ketoacyl synthase N-terminal-like domain-containing protein, partial [Solirubrobacteraceae bacterium]